MDPYVVTFDFELGIGVIGPAFYISLVFFFLNFTDENFRRIHGFPLP